ncbi:MAG: HpcH/HpaI aldolase/citrate lyase family protein, partial [Blastocatellia bacterium]
VRINRLDTGLGADDVTAMAGRDIAGLVIPKVERPEEISAVLELLQTHRPAHRAPFRLISMIESPRGVLNCPLIADAGPMMEGLLFGSADFSALTRARLTAGEPELLVARSRMLYSARAAGIAAWDAPFFSIPDLDGLRAMSELARNLGYDGRAIIHPTHIDIVNEIFSPSAVEIEQARGVVAAMRDATARGLAAVQYQGNLIEPLHARAAQRILDIAEILSAPITEKP